MSNESLKIEKVINPKDTAVIVIDLQNGYCSLDGAMSKLGRDVSINKAILPKVAKFLQVARSFHVLIIFTRMIEDPKYMADNARLKAGLCPKSIEVIASPGTFDFEYAEVSPTDGDMEIIKKSYDCFSVPNLEHILTERKIKNLIILGVNGDVCVDTTVRSAFTKGYNVVVPKDLIGTTKEKIYRQASAIELWEQFFAYVVESTIIISSWANDKN